MRPRHLLKWLCSLQRPTVYWMNTQPALTRMQSASMLNERKDKNSNSRADPRNQLLTRHSLCVCGCGGLHVSLYPCEQNVCHSVCKTEQWWETVQCVCLSVRGIQPELIRCAGSNWATSRWKKKRKKKKKGKQTKIQRQKKGSDCKCEKKDPKNYSRGVGMNSIEDKQNIRT